MGQRIVAAAAISLDDLSEVLQGQTATLTADQEETLDAVGALVPKNFASFAEFEAFKQDVYRGGRGDMTAAGRLGEARAGSIVDIDRPTGTDTAAYAEWLRSESPSADTTVDAAEDDPAKAQAILEAEETVTGGEPRKGVAARLTKIIEG